MPLIDVNIVAVIVAAIAGVAIGVLWYSPIFFGKMWMSLSGISESKLKSMKQKSMVKPFALGTVASLIMSYILAQFLGYAGANTIAIGIEVGVLVWFGFIATVLINSVLWEGKSPKLYMLNIAHYLVALVVMSVILTAL